VSELSSCHFAFYCCRHVAQFHCEKFHTSDCGLLAHSCDAVPIECGFDS
jgi:hypothetical protein